MGKPMMIDERDCDVDDLTLDDFVDGEMLESAHFIVSMMQLAKISKHSYLPSTQRAEEVVLFY